MTARKKFYRGYEALITEARAWVAALDRTPLGEFAVGADALSYMYAIRKTDATKDSNLRGAMMAVGTAEYTDALGTDKALPAFWGTQAMCEALFWLDRSDDMVLRGIGSVRFRMKDVDDFIGKLTLVHDNQHAHPYFSAGIWDMAVIEQCVADGIDPQMAKSLAEI